MKKLVVGVCGVLVFIGGLASLRSGVLKAGELPEESSLIVETGTIESAVSIPESSEAPVVEAPVPEIVEEMPAEEQPEVPVVETPEPSGTTESEEPTSSEPAPSESSTVDSSTNTSSTASSSASNSSSTKPSSSSSTSSTTTSSSTKPSNSSNSSSSKPSSTKPSTTTPNSSAPAQSSTSQSQEKPIQSVTPAPTPVVPSSPAAAAPITPEYASVQASSGFTPTVPEAFAGTSSLNLPSELKTTEVAQSDLKGFELPLLSSFENKNHAALIYEGIKQLGTEQEETYSAEDMATELYQQLFEREITGTPEKAPEELTVGSLLYQKKKEKNSLLGVYIGEEYYLTVDDVEIERETDNSSDAEETKKETQRQVVVESIDLEEDLLVQELPEVNLTEYGEQTLAEYPAAMNFTENEGAKSFIETVGEDARKLGQEYDVFASVMIAQALIESGSGTSSLSLAPNYNLFGIKGTYQGQAVSMATQEDRGNGELYSINSAFRKYPNYAASLGDYVELLRGGISGNAGYYQQTWRSTAKNYLRTTNALTGTYATDTTYGQKLNSIIALYHLTQYDQVKTTEGNSGVFIKGKDEIPEEYRSRMKYPDYNGIDYNSSGSYPVGQCTWYAFNRVKQLGKSVDDYMGNGGEWATKGKALGYEVSQKPKAGWLISFKPGVAGSDARYGHVAFVEVVRPEGILISEGNVYGGTVISYRVIDNALATSDQVSYVKAK
ncbi:glucosaminidase domain-containing protein [Enterococcus hulanensis]|uniref:glucosaminidase domain-containing protein n=1 Tax=Enterococcus hulanensis TaxID=2559929 RepID=UPI0010F76247|nr:glucosaminidase domain-containing protein [Enterococcus hulanensis]